MTTKKTAAQKEAEGVETAIVKHGDKDYTFPADAADWPVRATLAFEEGRAATAISALLGKEQWQTFMDTEPTNRELNAMFEQMAEAAGFELAGN